MLGMRAREYNTQASNFKDDSGDMGDAGTGRMGVDA